MAHPACQTSSARAASPSCAAPTTTASRGQAVQPQRIPRALIGCGQSPGDALVARRRGARCVTGLQPTFSPTTRRAVCRTCCCHGGTLSQGRNDSAGGSHQLSSRASSLRRHGWLVPRALPSQRRRHITEALYSYHCESPQASSRILSRAPAAHGKRAAGCEQTAD